MASELPSTTLARVLRCGVAIGLILCALPGCTRRDYRLRADRQSYDIIAEKQHPAWATPPAPIEAPPASRNFDGSNPDHPPMPPDDVFAHTYMHSVNGMRGYYGWHKDGDAPFVENPTWYDFLQSSENGELELTRERAVDLGMLHSREYLFALEQLYLAALRLTFERFEFQVQWFAGNTTAYEHFGTSSRPTESNTLTTSSNVGFSRSFATGGELLTSFANSIVWEFTGENSQTTMSNIAVRFVQPLLRGAFRNVRLEPLTQAERDVLYEARDFARFRKVFYFDIVSGDDGFLSLLLQLQAIRNQEANVRALEENLRAHEALALAGIVSPLQVDQVFTTYQRGRFSLVQARNDLQTSLDAYKIRLGLPPALPTEIDDAILAPFELNSPEIQNLEAELTELLIEFRERDQAPGLVELESGFQRLQNLQAGTLAQAQVVSQELERWKQREPSGTDEVDRRRELSTRDSLTSRLEQLNNDIERLQRDINDAKNTLATQTPEVNWESIQQLARLLATHLSDLFVMQTQIRVYLIELQPMQVEAEEVIAQGVLSRLDLMNRKAQVVDEWRRIHVAADALEADLDVFLDADIANKPGSNNPFRFSPEASRYRVGFRFDSPLNRLAERNLYRQQQITYQRSRRAYIAAEDAVVQAIRLDLRNLEADRLNFEITRQSLVVAARQVELARVQLLAPGQIGDSSSTQDVLRALNDLLDAKNSLIATWVAYETDRLRLLLDTEALQLDERGFQINDSNNSDSEYELLDNPPGEPANDEE